MESAAIERKSYTHMLKAEVCKWHCNYPKRLKAEMGKNP